METLLIRLEVCDTNRSKESQILNGTTGGESEILEMDGEIDGVLI